MFKIQWYLIPTLLASSTVFANASTSGFELSAWLGGSVTSVRPGNILFFGETDALKPFNANPGDLTWGGGIARRYMLNRAALQDVSLALDVLHLQLRQQGEVWQYQMPTMNNYHYRLGINSTRFMVDSELTFQPLAKKIYPFIEGGLGFSRNHSNYADFSVPGFDGIGTDIGGQSRYAFAYTLGAGLKMPLNNHIHLSLRYLYANLGHANTAGVSNQDLLAPLQVRLRTQTWLAGLSWLF